MIEEIVNGIWENVNESCFYTEAEMKRLWRIIIRKAIAESQGNMNLILL